MVAKHAHAGGQEEPSSETTQPVDPADTTSFGDATALRLFSIGPPLASNNHHLIPVQETRLVSARRVAYRYKSHFILIYLLNSN